MEIPAAPPAVIRGSAVRRASLLLAVALMCAITVYPNGFLDHTGAVNHGLATLLMWGIAAGFVHGVGFVPRTRLWRLLLGPWAALPLMAVGVTLLTRNLVALA